MNNNGLLSFLEGVSQFTPNNFPLPDGKLIAPFWADVDTSGTGVVWYRSTTEAALLERFMTEPQIQDGFTPSYLFIATWDHVGYFSSNVDKVSENNYLYLISLDSSKLCHQTNTFQCLLATDGLKSYAVFLYADGEIQWTTGDASGGVNGLGGTPAKAGFNAGDNINFAHLPESCTPEIINVANTTNVGIPGVWIFQVDTNDIVTGICSTDTETQGESNLYVVIVSSPSHTMKSNGKLFPLFFSSVYKPSFWSSARRNCGDSDRSMF